MLTTLASPAVARPLSLLLSALLLGGCGAASSFTPGSGRKYTYTYQLVTPMASRSLFYQDGRIKAEFWVDERAIVFQLQNTTDEPAELLWSNVSLGIDNRFYRPRHASDMYSDSLRGAPVTIPPLGYVRDLAIPAEHVRFDGATWSEQELFPTVDEGKDSLRAAIRRNVGKTLRLFLPVRFASGTVQYDFGFEVASVRQIAWRDYRPVVREPRPPDRPPRAGTIDQITVVALAVGFLGLFAYLVSVPKQPPTE